VIDRRLSDLRDRIRLTFDAPAFLKAAVYQTACGLPHREERRDAEEVRGREECLRRLLVL
jgi:hypothetical protein